MLPKVIVFDFDEVVVLGSDAVKMNAWPKVFKKYGEAYRAPFEESKALYGGGRGGDRYDQMRYVFRHFNEPETDIPALLEKGAAIFDAQVQVGILALGVQPDTQATLEKLSEKYSLYINTATPLDPFRKTFDALSLGKYFKDAYGRPNSKVQNFQEIALRERVSPQEILFIGDAPTDYKAALESGCAFVGLADRNNNWGKSEQEFKVIHTVSELESVLDIR